MSQIDFTYYGQYYEGSRFITSDARTLDQLDENSIDLIVTSPPYWQLRDYGHADQLGQEERVEDYIGQLMLAINRWRQLLRPHGSVFLNIGDVYRDGCLVGIPARFELAVRAAGWQVANHIVWAKPNGVPDPSPTRLVNRHEDVFHLTLTREYYFDLYGLANDVGRHSNPGDVWALPHRPRQTSHLAPFPDELARRAILLGCPEHVCSRCDKPFERIVAPSMTLDENRPQAVRAMELFKKHNLSEEHFAAIRATGISDAGKAQIIQSGATGNAQRTRKLAKEAKTALGGYFREFTFSPKRHVGWKKCDCNAPSKPGTVLDPFIGSGTTARVANELGRNAIGADLTLTMLPD